MAHFIISLRRSPAAGLSAPRTLVVMARRVLKVSFRRSWGTVNEQSVLAGCVSEHGAPVDVLHGLMTSLSPPPHYNRRRHAAATITITTTRLHAAILSSQRHTTAPQH